MQTFDTFTVGQEVLTRGHKRGTVREVAPDGRVLVAFGPTHAGFWMKETALVSAALHDRAARWTRGGSTIRTLR